MFLPPPGNSESESPKQLDFASRIPPPLPQDNDWKDAEELFGYVRECIASGMDMDAIRKALIQRGHSPDNTERVLIDASVWIRKTFPEVAAIQRKQRWKFVAVCSFGIVFCIGLIGWTWLFDRPETQYYFLGATTGLYSVYFLFQELTRTKDV